MNKKEFVFSEASWVLMLSVFFVTLIFNGSIAFHIEKAIALPKGPISGLFNILYILVIPVAITRVVAFSKTKITLLNQEIIVHRSSLIGLPIKSDFRLHYSKIKEYAFLEDVNWYWLKLVDTNGKRYRIWKFGWFNNNEYKKFRDRLQNEIRWYNQETNGRD